MPSTKRKKETMQKEKTVEEPVKTASDAVPVEKSIFIGQKPVRNYVLACLTSLSAGSNKVVIKARGRAICRAVDTVEMLRRSMKGLQLQNILLSTEEVSREQGRKSNVSAIEITLTKP
jgi:DNA-binding protein